MSLKNIAENFLKRGFKDLTSREVWKSFMESVDIESGGINIPDESIISYAEQLVWRMNRCGKCVDAGKCIGYDTSGCSCSMPQKMKTPSGKCSEGRWEEMLDPDAWIVYKLERGIEITTA
jgi:hypothetical protein